MSSVSNPVGSSAGFLAGKPLDDLAEALVLVCYLIAGASQDEPDEFGSEVGAVRPISPSRGPGNAVDGCEIHFAPHKKPWETITFGIYLGIISPGFLTWGKMVFVHPQYHLG